MHRLLAAHGVPLASNQIEVNLLRQSPFKNGLIDKMNELGVVGLAYSPLAQGRLTGKYSVRPGSCDDCSWHHEQTSSLTISQAENPPPSGRRFSNIPMVEIDPLVAEMRKIADDRGVSVSAIAINWVLSKGLIPLGGAKNAEQAEQVRPDVGSGHHRSSALTTYA
jgi:aryl-alcohol dehydrogenase-like predicted oxidoreductase